MTMDVGWRMRRSRSLLLLASAWSVAVLMNTPPAHAVDAFIRAPAYDTNLANALKSAESASRNLEQCLQEKREGKPGPSPGDSYDRQIYDRICHAEAQTTDIDCLNTTMWLSVDQIPNGAEALAILNRRAETGNPFLSESVGDLVSFSM